VVRAPIAVQLISSERHDRVERLGTGRQAKFGHIEKQFARQQNSLFDMEGIVQVRIIDQALPTDRGAGLLEVNPHHEHQRGFDLRG
jgi:hypothetical protein